MGGRGASAGKGAGAKSTGRKSSAVLSGRQAMGARRLAEAKAYIASFKGAAKKAFAKSYSAFVLKGRTGKAPKASGGWGAAIKSKIDSIYGK